MVYFEFEVRKVGNKSNPSYVFPIKKEDINNGKISLDKKNKFKLIGDGQ